jgi:tetratricopeptide (TPR) repeat protein
MKMMITCFMFFFGSLGLYAEDSYHVLEQANVHYEKGVQAKTIAEREQEFNQALQLYFKTLEDFPSGTYARGQINYNIGNVLYMLEEYPWAILFYERALIILPHNQDVIFNRDKARNKLGLEASEPFLIRQWLAWPSRFAEEDLIKIFFIFGMVTLLCIALRILTQLRVWKWFAWTGLAATLLLAYGVFFHHFFIPVRAVSIEPMLIHKGPGENVSLVSDQPQPAGEVYQVAELTGDGKWVKITNNSGLIGYVPASSLRFVVSLE